MSRNINISNRVALLGVFLEGGLALVALAIGRLIDFDPLATLRLDRASLPGALRAAGWGLLATLPLLLFFAAARRFPVGPLKRLKQLLDESVGPLFAPLAIWQLALISLAAGVGEELLFRGLLQAALADRLPSPHSVLIAVAVASTAFGVCHWISKTYAVLATAAGLYFGWLLIASDHLVTPVTTHAVYDFVVLVYLKRRSAKKGGPTEFDQTAFHLPDQIDFPGEEVNDVD